MTKKKVPAKASGGPKGAGRGSKTKAAPRNVRSSEAWKAAEWMYGSLIASDAFPMFGKPMTEEEKARSFVDILKECPEFYPAWLDMGVLALRRGEEKAGIDAIERGTPLLLASRAKGKEEELDVLIDNLERIWRFDIAKTLLEQLVRRRPKHASYRDSLAHATARMGDLPSAIFQIDEAVRLAPDDFHCWSNKGWYHLMAGDLTRAREALATARKLNPKNEVIKNNFAVLSYMEKHGGSYFDYLLRPVDWRLIRRLEEKEDPAELDQVCADYNQGRREAMVQHLFLEGGKSRALAPLRLARLLNFFTFVRGLSQEARFLEEEILYFHSRFETIWHKFIIKFYDVDRTLIEEIYASVLVYYDFLTRRKLVDRSDYRDFKKDALAMKPRLLKKMEAYNAFRRKGGTEDEREKVLNKLFEGDHFWPHI